MSRRGLGIALLLALAPAVARAEELRPGEVPAKARMLADRGRAYHDAGDYANAIAAFKEAYVIAPSAALLFNLAQAYRLQGSCDDAALMYRRYIASDPSPEGRALAETHLATVERCVHKLGLHIPVETAGGRLIEPPPPDAPVITVQLDAKPRKARIEKDIGIGLTVGGGAALAVAGYYAYVAHDAANAVADAYAKGAKWRDVQDTDARGKSAATTAKYFAIGGGAAVATGVVMYIIGKRAEHAPVVVAPTGRGAEVSLAWQF